MAGLYTVFKKELEDSFTSWRFLILFTLVLLAGVSAIYVAWGNIRQAVTGSTEFVFLALFTTSGGAIPSFLSLITILIPLVGIVMGLDAVNSERNNGTLSRLISQPIYRDTLINAKFLAGVTTIGLMMLSIILLVSGLGIRMIGIPPTSEEAWRLLFFLIISIIYGAFWLGLAILFSIFFRRVATSALATIAIWIFFYFFFGNVAGLVANALAPAGDTIASQIHNIQFQIMLSRISPIGLFQESMAVLLIPGARTVDQLFQLQLATGQPTLGTPLSLLQSLITVWPFIITIIMLTVICFAVSYIKFMREEIRAT